MPATKMIEDLRVIFFGLMGILSTYLTTLDWLRVVVLIITLLYTVRRWYLMEKRNKNYKNNQENKKTKR